MILLNRVAQCLEYSTYLIDAISNGNNGSILILYVCLSRAVLLYIPEDQPVYEAPQNAQHH